VGFSSGTLPLTPMALPYFFVADLQDTTLVLEEATSKHVIQVLRMQQSEELLLTDGKGKKAIAVITNDNRKRCEVTITSFDTEPLRTPQVTIALSIVKNASRYEWFLEKATEIGVTGIIPLLCERTEKEKFRYDRMQQILVSALLQSQQCWLPVLHQPVAFRDLLTRDVYDKKYIAHCLDQQKLPLHQQPLDTSRHTLILIGPEGDFTPQEIDAALQQGFMPVTLGETRLRTETAGLVAAVWLCAGRSAV
jgi:16S rRNA (uracil1498-N3)-methyltransferase